MTKRTHGTRRPAVVALVAAAMVLATACSRGGGDDASPTGRDEPGAPRPGGVLRVGVTRLLSLDPARARTVDELLVTDQLFDSLTAYDPTTLEPVPSLAARWQTSPDQLHWDFYLRPEATFANGRPIVAADVKYSFDRVAAKATASPVADLLESVVGFAAVNVDGSTAELAGVVAPGPDVVHIDLERPLSVLPNLLGSPALGVVARESVEAQPPAPAFADQPVGGGPFRVRSRSDKVIALERAPGSGALLDGVELVAFDTVEAAYQAFVAGRIDWSQVPNEHLAAAGQRYGRGAYRPYLAELFYGFNLRNPKFADLRFREAIVRAINRDAIVDKVYSGSVTTTHGLLVTGVAGTQADPCGERCRYDPARSKALLAEVFGGSPPPEIQIDFDDDETQVKVATAMQADLVAVGIPTGLRAKTLEEYQRFAVNGETELFRLGWIAAYPSPDALLTPLFATGLPSNLSGFSRPEVDTALQSARSEPDGVRRLNLYQAAERAILAELPVVPIAQFEIHAVVGSRVRGLVLTADGLFDGSKVWLTAGA